MSKTMSELQAQIALTGDALDQLRYDRDQVFWLEALMRAISDDLKSGSHGAAALASLGQYLACDLANYIDRQVAHFEDAQDAAEGGK